MFYANYAPDTQARAEHLKDKSKLFADLKDGFPQVAFFKPAGSKNQHPGYSTISEADQEVKEIVEAIRSSAIWPSTAIVITYDEFGGLWDHVAPPKGDRWGPGTRVPTLLISPFAKKGFIDHVEGRLDLSGLAWTLAREPMALGDFRFDIRTTPEAVIADASSPSGPLEVLGDARLLPDRSWQLKLRLKPRPGASETLLNYLRSLGMPDAEGYYPVRQQGRLP